MGRVKPCRDDKEHEESIRLAKEDFISGIEPSIRSAARTYGAGGLKPVCRLAILAGGFYGK